MLKYFLYSFLFCSLSFYSLAASYTDETFRLKNLYERYFGSSFSKVESCTPLKGGLSKYVWKVTHQGTNYVFKLLPGKSDSVETLREGFFAAIAAKEGVGPRIFFVDIEYQGVIQEYVEPQKQPYFEDTKTCDIVMQKLQKFHQSFGHNPYSHFRHRLSEIEALQAPVIPAMRRSFAFAEEIEKATWQFKSSHSLVHGDFHIGQLVGKGKNVMLIDFADSSIGDGMYDVAKFSFRIKYPESLLHSYLGREPTKKDKAYFQVMRLLVYLDIASNRYLLWAKEQTQNHTLQNFSYEEIEKIYRQYLKTDAPLNLVPSKESLLGDSIHAFALFEKKLAISEQYNPGV